LGSIRAAGNIREQPPVVAAEVPRMSAKATWTILGAGAAGAAFGWFQSACGT